MAGSPTMLRSRRAVSDAIAVSSAAQRRQSQTSETAGARPALHQRCRTAPSPAPLTVKLDKTGPRATLAVTAVRPAQTAGTRPSHVATPALTRSAVRQLQRRPALTTETTGSVFHGTCTNDAGLTTDASPLTVKLDKTGPTATLCRLPELPARTAGTRAMSPSIPRAPIRSATRRPAALISTRPPRPRAPCSTAPAPTRLVSRPTPPR